MSVPAALLYEFCALTDQGRVRSNNEDAVAVDVRGQVAVLADGMGGYNAGEVASTMATDLIRQGLVQWLDEDGRSAPPSDLRVAMEACVESANRAIYQASQSNPQYAGMGTTVVVAVFKDDRLVLGHIGDSRCYRLRNRTLYQITRDHSWLQEQVDAGILTPQEAALSGFRNLVTRALGVEETTLLEVNEFQVEPNDLFILCSDGLTDMVGDDELQVLVNGPEPLAERAARLIEAANVRGGRDNISVLLAQACAAEKKRGLVSRLLLRTD
ncbi:Stp1/IreP family PP2C-type Ser/Thr phosphatase [Paracidovorax anthurii]|uniref:Protein phosphatase n=1 Tax=Paracidovorax anthurii TaxID=78229 RepID=A0A328ZN54_9BURK|nr:Stp1/IreP family PP2C-type Ser/Thr phosphatase [Paracidovorax anthurii]RAR84297.1 protein phosphatase [Paracidovorax anthurii]WCM93051.1 Stp1/IreP family PP2C-type Ser/Thr phosphatase [Acidovorax sp. NCPPB 2350]